MNLGTDSWNHSREARTPIPLYNPPLGDSNHASRVYAVQTKSPQGDTLTLKVEQVGTGNIFGDAPVNVLLIGNKEALVNEDVCPKRIDLLGRTSYLDDFVMNVYKPWLEQSSDAQQPANLDEVNSASLLQLFINYSQQKSEQRASAQGSDSFDKLLRQAEANTREYHSESRAKMLANIEQHKLENQERIDQFLTHKKEGKKNSPDLLWHVSKSILIQTISLIVMFSFLFFSVRYKLCKPPHIF